MQRMSSYAVSNLSSIGRIMSIDSVVEVFLTDGIGEYGCVVKSREHCEGNSMGGRICRKAGLTACEVMAISYRR